MTQICLVDNYWKWQEIVMMIRLTSVHLSRVEPKILKVIKVLSYMITEGETDKQKYWFLDVTPAEEVTSYRSEAIIK